VYIPLGCLCVNIYFNSLGGWWSNSTRERQGGENDWTGILGCSIICQLERSLMLICLDASSSACLSYNIVDVILSIIYISSRINIIRLPLVSYTIFLHSFQGSHLIFNITASLLYNCWHIKRFGWIRILNWRQKTMIQRSTGIIYTRVTHISCFNSWVFGNEENDTVLFYWDCAVLYSMETCQSSWVARTKEPACRTRRRRDRVSGEFLDGSSWIDPFAPAVRVVSYFCPSSYTARFLFRSKTFLRKKNQIKSKLTLWKENRSSYIIYSKKSKSFLVVLFLFFKKMVREWCDSSYWCLLAACHGIHTGI
jgi:hypothetical protein